MKSRVFILVIMAAVTLTGCHRGASDVWEDTKTCGRYMGKGIRSLFGRHVDDEEYAFLQERNGPFIPLTEEDSYEPITFEEVESSATAVRNMAAKIMDASIEQFVDPAGPLKKIFANIHFETDNYSVKGSENYSCLQKIADYLHAHPNTFVYIEGHADERGAAAYNLALGSRRANAVSSFLVQNGVNPDQLKIISYGKERPLSLEHDQDAWKVNRRAQFKLYER